MKFGVPGEFSLFEVVFLGLFAFVCFDLISACSALEFDNLGFVLGTLGLGFSLRCLGLV